MVLREYDRVVGGWIANGRDHPSVYGDGLTVAEVMARHLDCADTYYRHADGTPTTEPSKICGAMKALRRLYGHTPAVESCPLSHEVFS